MHVDTIPEAMRAAHLWLKLRRRIFPATEMSFVGLKVNSRVIQTEDRKIAGINDWSEQASTAQLWSIRGLAEKHRWFKHKFAHQTTVLYAVTAIMSTFRWIQRHQAWFDDIPRDLASALVLVLHNPDCDYTLCTNASDMAISGVLAQNQPSGL